MSAIPVIVGYALREALRRKVFVVVLLLTIAFLALYAFGTVQIFQEVEEDVRGGAGGGAPRERIPIDEQVAVGATLLGLSMFGTLFLATVLAIFLTLGVVRGDAERGLLQPLVVRPVGRATLLVSRFLAAAAVAVPYVLIVYGCAVAITRAAGGWTPDRVVAPGLELAGAVAIVAAISLVGSVFLTATANGIAVFMVFGAGLVAGLLGQIGEALDSETLRSIADTAAWVLPFEALYQDALARLTADTFGLTDFVVQLGPFGGAQARGALLFPWAVVYVALLMLAGVAAFRRRDL
ncbi:MAG: ABC transporter permease subunit [Actinobacteria bacterium]|nr:ABC transporter permease subunit [Actinomycetota bacterium]